MMKNLPLFAILLTALCASCDSVKNNHEEFSTVKEVATQEATIGHLDSIEEPPPPPPPPRYTSKFATFGEWLNNLCSVENSDSRVQYYEVFLSKKENPISPGNVQYFMGITGSEQNRNEDSVYDENSAHFYPKEIYLTPAKSIYSALNGDQAVQKVTEELKKFVQSPPFRQCFLRKARSIKFKDKVIL